MTVLITPNVVRVREDVEDQIYNWNPTDTPLVSMIDREPIASNYHEWTRDNYRAADGTRGAIEGADYAGVAIVQPGPLNNRTQIIQDAVSISNTTQAVKKAGRKDEVKYQLAKKMIECKKDIEAAAIGSGAAVTGTSGTAPKMRGLYGFITNCTVGAGAGVAPDPTTNTAPVVGTLAAHTEAILQTGIQACFTNGGSASCILVSPAHKVKFSTFTGGVQRTNEVGSKAPAVLNAAWDFYRSDFGVHKVIPNRVQAVAVAGLRSSTYLIDPDKIALGQLRGWESEQMATTGDAKNWQVRTEVTLIMRDEKPMYSILDRTVTGS